MKRVASIITLAWIAASSHLMAEVPSTQPSNIPTLKVSTVAIPITTSRCFNWGLAPNPRGGWNWVGQLMNYQATGNKEKLSIDLPSGQHYLAYKDTKVRPEAEWVVVDLQTGKFRIFNWPGFHTAAPPCLAENGRLFFSVDYAHLYYYDPMDEAVKPVGRFHEDIQVIRSFYRIQSGPDGMIYASAQSTNGQTALLQLNPDTLETRLIRDIGLAGRRPDLTYGYYLAVDPPWAYIAVGQGNWELFAVNVETGEKKCLAEVQGDGSRIVVSQGQDFCSAKITGKPDVWLVDGQAISAVEGQKPVGMPIGQRKYQSVAWTKTKRMDLSQPPELDAARPVDVRSQGKADIYWRKGVKGQEPAPGAVRDQGGWEKVSFTIQNSEPVRIESLTALPDGSLLGNGYSYNGFFRYHPQDQRLEYYGKHGPETLATALDQGKVWICGYPNVNLSVYDPTQPWTSKKADRLPADAAPVNPSFIGYFGQTVTEAHRCSFLLAPGNGRIYICGTRERWSSGTGLGYYEIATGKKFGLGTANKEVDPAGFIALPKLNRLIFSGNGKTEGKLIVYDMDLKEVERLQLNTSLSNTNSLFNAGSDSAFLGCYQDPSSKTWILYLYDLSARKILKSVPVADAVHVMSRPADNTFWLLSGGTLSRLDPQTLAITPVAKFERGFGLPTWVGKELYGRTGGELVKVAQSLP